MTISKILDWATFRTVVPDEFTADSHAVPEDKEEVYRAVCNIINCVLLDYPMGLEQFTALCELLFFKKHGRRPDRYLLSDCILDAAAMHLLSIHDGLVDVRCGGYFDCGK